jgi:hypothetical protein
MRTDAAGAAVATLPVLNDGLITYRLRRQGRRVTVG